LGGWEEVECGFRLDLPWEGEYSEIQRYIEVPKNTPVSEAYLWK